MAYSLKQVFAAAWLATAAVAASGQAHYAQVVVVNKTFADAKDSLVLAIEGQGLVINTTAHVGAMLERTGKDVGSDKKIFENAEVIEFCSAKVSRAVMETDPRALVLCPYSIALYTLPNQPGKTQIAYRKFPADSGAAQVENLIEGIVKEAVK